MRPITNILLILALICYIFLPFYDISLHGSGSGMGFTAGTISQSLSIGHVALALLPFITVFGAIALNCLKKRWWTLGSIALIALAMWFFMNTGNPPDIMLQHAPEVTPDNDLGEGFTITGTGIGHKLSFVLVCLSLLSAIVSLLPFKFNETLEKAVDDKFEDSRRHVRNEFSRLESNLHKSHKPKQSSPTPPPAEDTPAEPAEDKEDPRRFMPKE